MIRTLRRKHSGQGSNTNNTFICGTTSGGVRCSAAICPRLDQDLG